MPNEQTSVPLYAASEVLTAANMNISAGTGVPVFATTVTRDAAFGGANEKVLAEGQLCYLSATNVVQYYDGAAWATVGPAAAGGLSLITSGSTSAAASLTLDGVFTSTYRNYRLFVNGTTSVDDIDVPLNFRTSGVTNSNSNYFRLGIDNVAAGLSRNTGTTTSFTKNFASGTTQIVSEITFFAPQVAIATGINSTSTSLSTSSFQRIFGCVFTNTTQFDGFILTPTSGTITVHYRLYGLAD